jgi:diacylglycerol kinase (ATP)
VPAVGPTVHLLANPTARGGAAVDDIAAVERALAAAGAEVLPVRAGARHEVRGALRAALDDGATRVVLAGGDGLVHLAVQELAGRDVVTGIVPIGTGNDFVRALGLLDPTRDGVAGAVDAALADPVELDLVRTEHGWIASVAALGFAATVNARANRLPWPRGARRYTAATLLEIPRFRARPLVLHVDGVRHELEAAIVAAGNTAFFGGGMEICPTADPTDGLLDLIVIGPVGRFELLRMLPTVFRAEHVRHPAVTRFRGRELHLERADATDGPVPDADLLWGDGEPVGALPVTLTTVPAALRVAGARTVRAPGGGSRP